MLHPLAIPHHPWSQLSLDIVISPPMSEGYTELTIVDPFSSPPSRWQTRGLGRPLQAPQVPVCVCVCVHIMHTIHKTSNCSNSPAQIVRMLVLLGAFCVYLHLNLFLQKHNSSLRATWMQTNSHTTYFSFLWLLLLLQPGSFSFSFSKCFETAVGSAPRTAPVTVMGFFGLREPVSH